MISISEATGSPRGSTLTAGSGLEPYPRGYPQADCRPGAGSAGTQPAGTGGALHGRARILCLRGLGLSAAESARSYHQPGLYRHQSGRGVQGQDHGTQAFPVGDELRRLPGEDEVAPGLITPTPDRLCRGRAIEDAIQLHCVELARIIFEMMFGRKSPLERMGRAKIRCPSPKFQPGREPSTAPRQIPHADRPPPSAFAARNEPKRSTKRRSSCAGFRHSVRPREARRSLKSTSTSSCRLPRPMSHRSRHNYRNGLCTKRITQIE
jgi:hypothetical protein